MFVSEVIAVMYTQTYLESAIVASVARFVSDEDLFLELRVLRSPSEVSSLFVRLDFDLPDFSARLELCSRFLSSCDLVELAVE